MQRVFSEKNALFSGTMDKQNVTLTSLFEKLEIVYNKVQELQITSSDDNQRIRDLQHNDKKLSVTLKEGIKRLDEQLDAAIKEDRVRIAQLERAVQSRAQGLEAPEAGPGLLKPDLKI